MFTKLSELILGKISNFTPTFLNDIEVEVTGDAELVVKVALATGISSVIEILAALLSDVTRIGFASTSACEFDANNSSFALSRLAFSIIILPPGTRLAVAPEIEVPRIEFETPDVDREPTLAKSTLPMDSPSKIHSIPLRDASSICRSMIKTSISTCCGSRSNFLTTSKIAE
jgi:hypothetical protein